MRPTLNDVHVPGPMNSSGSPVSKPWSTSSPPPPAANWSEPERELCARVANRILADGGTDKEAVLGCISAVQSARANKAEGFTPPKAAQENARRVLRWREEYPDEIQGMTQVGWTRARQLASGEAVSLDIVRRMAQFNRHRQNATVDPRYKNEPWRDAGLVAWLGWGGTAGIDWAIRVSQAELSKANYSKQVCMNCKENPPKYRILRNGGQVESWLCEVCFPSWLNDNLGSVTHYNKIGEDGLPKRYKVRRTVKSEAGMEGIEKEWAAQVIEKQEDRQIVYGVVLRVGQVDSQGDIITDEKEILEAAHNYMIKSRRADWQHEKTLPHEKAIAVESYIAPCDFEINGHQIKKSDWIVGMKIFDPKMWQAIKKGEISAFSIKGLGRRKAVDGP